MSTCGTPFPLNPECGPYFQLGLHDGLKFRQNRKSYPQLIYEALGLVYRGQAYQLHPDRAARTRARAHWQALGVGDNDVLVGLNTGAGGAFANKNWAVEKFARLARRWLARGVRVAVVGGPGERTQNARLATDCPGLLDGGCDHAELEFAALLQRCRVVVTGDTFALHVAVAMQVPCVALFGPTCPQEIDLFGRGERVLTNAACAPCYRRSCTRSPNCMDGIPVEDVDAAIERILEAAGTQVRVSETGANRHKNGPAPVAALQVDQEPAALEARK